MPKLSRSIPRILKKSLDPRTQNHTMELALFKDYSPNIRPTLSSIETNSAPMKPEVCGQAVVLVVQPWSWLSLSLEVKWKQIQTTRTLKPIISLRPVMAFEKQSKAFRNCGWIQGSSPENPSYLPTRIGLGLCRFNQTAYIKARVGGWVTHRSLL